jgi:uncharacterized protein (TIGR02646 family)
VRPIEKGAPPPEIVSYRNDTTPFDEFRHKDSVRRALTEEQGFLCCYCLRRINPDADSMKIEHWAPQAIERERWYDWSNLLGACPGGTAGAARHQTCDTHKGSTPITVNPTLAEHVARVRFRGDGTVYSEDPLFEQDLNRTLNLNDVTLVAARRARVAAVHVELRKHEGSWSRALLERQLDKWRPRRMTGRLPEFCEVVAQELERRLPKRP